MPVGIRIPRKDFRDSKLKDTHRANLRAIESWSETVSTPAGMLAPYAGATAPDGWLLCEGQAVKRAQYQGLFAVIGTTYGSGDGSTTFNVPNLRGRFALGKDTSGTGSTLGGTGGSFSGHTHGIDQGGAHDHSLGNSGTDFAATNVQNAGGGTNAGTHGHGGTSTQSDHAHSGNTQSNQAIPPFIAIHYMIKV